MEVNDLLSSHRLKDTKPRRMVLAALTALGAPSQKDIQVWTRDKGSPVNLVTVYRVLQKFEDIGIVHRQPSSGGFLLCSLSEHGHHGILTCQACGSVEEFSNTHFCHLENLIAKRAGFRPLGHISEIIGLCSCCSS